MKRMEGRVAGVRRTLRVVARCCALVSPDVEDAFTRGESSCQGTVTVVN